MRDEAWVRNEASPRAADRKDDLAHTNLTCGEHHWCQRGTLRPEKRKVSPCVAANDARDDVAVCCSRANLIITVQQMVGDDE